MNAMTNRTSNGFFSKKSMGLLLICLAAVVGISYATIKTQFEGDSIFSQPTYVVEQGPLTISVPVAGTIQAREKEIIQNELEGSSTIIYLIPEGKRVKKGELLVELDASNLIDQRVDQQIKVQNAEAAYINARENLAIVESQAQSDIDKAQLVYDFAVQDLKKYEDGDFPKLKKEAETKIAETQENLNLQNEKVKWSRILYEEKYLSQTELQNDELSAYRIKNQLDLANKDLELLNQYTYTRQIAQLKSDVSQAKMALERTKRQANANIVQASAQLQAKLAEYDQEKNKLAKLDDQIGKAKIYAKMDGLVVYATSVRMGRDFRGGSSEPLEAGRTVREREELIHLPTTAAYKVDAKVQESSLEKIHVGLPVRITVDAIPGKVYTGKVATIAPLPNAQSMFMNPDLKVYDTEIYIDGADDDLRSGMGCLAEIIVDYYPDATYVPVHAVLRIGTKPTVFVANGNKWEPRTVDLGLDNNSLAHIKSGLKKGEIVLLTPPLSTAEMVNQDRIQDATDLPQMLKEAKENLAKAAIEEASRAANRQSPGGEGFSPPPMQGSFPGGGPGGMGRPNFQNMTPEQLEQMRQRFENMTPEEREQMRQRFQQGGFGGQRGQGGPGGSGRPDSQNMTPEQREQMRQRFQNMTPEEREAMRQNRRQSRQGDESNPSPPQNGSGQQGQ